MSKSLSISLINFDYSDYDFTIKVVDLRRSLLVRDWICLNVMEGRVVV